MSSVRGREAVPGATSVGLLVFCKPALVGVDSVGPLVVCSSNPLVVGVGATIVVGTEVGRIAADETGTGDIVNALAAKTVGSGVVTIGDESAGRGDWLFIVGDGLGANIGLLGATGLIVGGRPNILSSTITRGAADGAPVVVMLSAIISGGLSIFPSA